MAIRSLMTERSLDGDSQSLWRRDHLMAHRSLDIGSVRVHPLVQRASKHALADILIDPEAPAPDAGPMAPVQDRVATAMRVARDSGASVILCYGAHLVRNGLAPIVSRMLETGWITHLATNGSGVIHDREYAFEPLGRGCACQRRRRHLRRLGRNGAIHTAGAAHRRPRWHGVRGESRPLYLRGGMLPPGSDAAAARVGNVGTPA